MSYHEERLGELFRLLPEVPEGWVRAAQELPAARAALDTLVARAEANAAERDWIVRRPRGCPRRGGREPTSILLAEARARLFPQ